MLFRWGKNPCFFQKSKDWRVRVGPDCINFSGAISYCRGATLKQRDQGLASAHACDNWQARAQVNLIHTPEALEEEECHQRARIQVLQLQSSPFKGLPQIRALGEGSFLGNCRGWAKRIVHLIRWPSDSQRKSGQFARISSRESIRRKKEKKKKTICITFERFARIASNLRFAIFCPPEARFANKGFGSGTLKRFARIRRFVSQTALQRCNVNFLVRFLG